ncbi:MAG: metallophosphoesterase [Peptostreptococcales bacterium]
MKVIKFFHISDIHIGMKFQSYSEKIREKLIEARFTALEKAVTEADARMCDVLAITGDLFESIKVSKKNMERVQQILKAFNGEYIFVLPGNHDFYDSNLKLWGDFAQLSSDKTVLFTENKKHEMTIGDIKVTVYAAPCGSKHSERNNLGWIKDEKLDADTLNILLAHGAIKDISPDLNNNYFPMTLAELKDIQMDCCLLGHTHVPYPAKDEVHHHTIFNAGTPEPDGLNYRYEGSGWFIEIDEEKNVHAKRIGLGSYRFFDTALEVSNDLDEADLMKALDATEPQNSIIRLKLTGYLDKESYENRYALLNPLGDRFLYFEVNEDELRPKFTAAMIEESFMQGSLPYTFLLKLLKETDEETAHYAYEFMMEVKND